MGERFLGKTALVTGSAQGIGKATALRLAQEGASVVLVDRALDACIDVQRQIQEAGGAAMTINVDLETSEGAEQMVAEALSWRKVLDIAVHNVGGTMWTKPFWEYDTKEMESEIQRSLWPTLFCSRAVIPVMMKQKSGSIVNVGSTATRGLYRVPYAAAKGGVAATTVAMALELGRCGIRVNCVAPGLINSNRVIPRNNVPPGEKEREWRASIVSDTIRETAMGRAGEAHEVAAAIAFLASDEASFITGQVLYVSGGPIG